MKGSDLAQACTPSNCGRDAVNGVTQTADQRPPTTNVNQHQTWTDFSTDSKPSSLSNKEKTSLTFILISKRRQLSHGGRSIMGEALFESVRFYTYRLQYLRETLEERSSQHVFVFIFVHAWMIQWWWSSWQTKRKTRLSCIHAEHETNGWEEGLIRRKPSRLFSIPSPLSTIAKHDANWFRSCPDYQKPPHFGSRRVFLQPYASSSITWFVEIRNVWTNRWIYLFDRKNQLV